MDTIYHMTRKAAWVSFHLGGVTRIQLFVIRLKGPLWRFADFERVKFFLPHPSKQCCVPLDKLAWRGKDYFSLLSVSFEDSVSQRKGKQFKERVQLDREP